MIAITHQEGAIHLEIPDIFEALIPQADEDSVREAREEYHAPPKPYFVNEERGIRLYQGDAMELLKRTKSEMFDLSQGLIPVGP